MTIDKIMSEVQAEYGMSGLSDGIYGSFAREVAERCSSHLKTENEALRLDAERYRWLRARNMDTIHKGGVFAGVTPKNLVINGEDLDRHVDAAISAMTTNSIITALVAGLLLGAWLAQADQRVPGQASCPPASSIPQLSPHEKPSRPMPAVAPAHRQVAERFWL